MNLLSSIPEWLRTLTCVSAGAVALAWLATLILRRKSAALRHFLWLLALCAPLAALPLGWVHPRIAIPILPHAAESASAHDLAPLRENLLQPIVSARTEQALAVASSLPTPRPRFTPSVNPWLGGWVLGAAFLIARLLFAHRRMKRFVQDGCSSAPKELVRHLDVAQRHFKLTRKVRLMVTPLAEIPFCCGAFRSTVVFPESWRQWDEQRIEVCLTHELAHICRGDLLTMLVGQLACILCWFNPLVWFATAKLRDEAEKSADDLVLARNIGPETYAANLVAMAEHYRASALSASGIALAMARPTRLHSRVHAILDSTLRRQSPGWAMRLTISLLAMSALATTMVVRLTAAPAPAAAIAQDRDLAALDLRTRDTIRRMSFAAIKDGDIQTIDSFLKRGLDVNVDFVSTAPLLFLAVDNNQPAIVKLLLANGADANQKTSWEDTPIKRACWRGYKDIADALIQAGAHVDNLQYAAGMGDVAGLEARDKKQFITDKEAKDTIKFAVASGHQSTFDWLWKRLGPMDDQQKDKLLGDLYESAGKWSQPDILRRLEELGATSAKFGSQALVNAVSGNHPEVVKYLLEKGVSPNVTPPRWGNMLRDSAGEGHLEIVRLLLDHGADINIQDGQGLTPLSWATHNGEDAVCLLLLERGADINIEDHEGRNAAWGAAGGIHCPAALETMIKKGVKLTGRDKLGMTILNAMMYYAPPLPGETGFPGKIYSASEIEAYNQRERRVVEALIAAGVDFNGQEGSATPLMSALEVGHFAAARTLLDHGANLSIKNQYGDTAMFYLFEYPNNGRLPLDILETFLKRGVNPNLEFRLGSNGPDDALPLVEEAIAAARVSSADLDSYRAAIQMLLDHGAVFPKVADDRTQNWLKAATKGNLPVLQEMIHQGTPISAADGNGWDALIISLALGYVDCANWLIDHGADAVGHNRRAWYSPLQFAVERGQADLVDKLIAKGAKPAATDGVIYRAVEQKNPRILNALLNAGADPKDGFPVTVSSGGKTYVTRESLPLFLCIRDGQIDMAKTLLDKGADPDPANLQDDLTLVHWAVQYDQPQILKALLDHGANPSRKDTKGETPLDLTRKSHQKLIPILEEAIKHTPGAKEADKA